MLTAEKNAKPDMSWSGGVRPGKLPGKVLPLEMLGLGPYCEVHTIINGNDPLNEGIAT